SLVRTGYPNEWEFFGRWHMLSQDGNAPLDASIHGAWNQAASSADAELTLARRIGQLRLLGAGRVLSDAYHAGETRFAAGGCAALMVLDWLALAGHVMTLLQRAPGEEVTARASGPLATP